MESESQFRSFDSNAIMYCNNCVEMVDIPNLSKIPQIEINIPTRKRSSRQLLPNSKLL